MLPIGIEFDDEILALEKRISDACPERRAVARLTGRTTCAPAPTASSVVLAGEPSSTTTTFGSQDATLVLAIIRASLKPGIYPD